MKGLPWKLQFLTLAKGIKGHLLFLVFVRINQKLPPFLLHRHFISPFLIVPSYSLKGDNFEMKGLSYIIILIDFDNFLTLVEHVYRKENIFKWNIKYRKEESKSFWDSSFTKMQLAGVVPHFRNIASILPACGRMGALE